MQTSNILIAATAIVIFFSCKKQDEWLDIKKNKSDVRIAKLEDLKALMDNDAVMNANYPVMGFISADNFIIKETTWNSLGTASERNGYVWAKDIYGGRISNDWNAAYQMISYANLALDGLSYLKESKENHLLWNTIKGRALFFRAFGHYNLAQLYAAVYDPATAGTKPGIPLRTTADVNYKVSRGTVEQTYQQIITDLLEARSILPIIVETKTTPSRPAADALLARTYLNMRNYPLSIQHADSALKQQNTILNFNTLDGTIPRGFTLPTFQKNNPEVIFYASSISYGVTTGIWIRSTYSIDTTLYKSYAAQDLRTSIFYTTGYNSLNFRGSYTGSSSLFAGLATNELYLIRAEAYAQTIQLPLALKDLNNLLENRFEKDAFTSYTETDPEKLIAIIHDERRKELPFTGNLRWEDLRRFNRDGANIRLQRIFSTQTYTLEPNDPRYVLPIPDAEILISGLEQNQR